MSPQSMTSSTFGLPAMAARANEWTAKAKWVWGRAARSAATTALASSTSPKQQDRTTTNERGWKGWGAGRCGSSARRPRAARVIVVSRRVMRLRELAEQVQRLQDALYTPGSVAVLPFCGRFVANRLLPAEEVAEAARWRNHAYLQELRASVY